MGDLAATEAERAHATASAQDQVWYLYGVTGRRAPDGSMPAGIEGQPVEVVEIGDLAAIVSPVPAADYSAGTLTERAADAAWLEAMVRDHNGVIAAVHAEQAILPAKFGSVYAHIEDLRAALDRMRAAVGDRLEWLEQADEWAVHLYADRTAIEGRAAAVHPDIRDLHAQLIDARPGRAYFLQRKLRDELTAATDEMLTAVARAAYDSLASHALASQVSSPARTARAGSEGVEILRAAFLVARDATDAFSRAVDALGDEEGMEVVFTGPWPPYSFVTSMEGEAE